MVLRFITITVFFIITSINFANAQDKEFGLKVGFSNYQGDLSGDGIIPPLSETQPSFGLLYRYYFSPKFDVKASLTYARASGDDKNFDDDGFRRKRNLSFYTNIFEASVQAEYNFLPYISNSNNYKWSPYVFGGVALFRFNPKTDFRGQTIDLPDIQTEGNDYNLIQLAIPFGAGIKYSLGDRWNIGLEGGFRKLFTDYLDDVSEQYVEKDDRENSLIADRSHELDDYDEPQFQPGRFRGNPDTDDWYGILGITITKTFRDQKCTGEF